MIPNVIPFPNIDPEIFTVAVGGFEFSLRWYALAYIVGLVIGWRLMVLLMKRPLLWPGQRAPMTPAEPEEMLTWMVFAVVIGGRIGYVLFYEPAAFVADPSRIVRIWEGGMSFHGGFLGVILATVIYTRLKGIPLLQASDAVALAAPVGLLLGRLANFVNGELWGRPTDVPWAMRFPTHAADGTRDWTNLTEPRHPSQLYEAFGEGLLLFIVLWWLATRSGWLKRPGAITGVFFAGYGIARTVAENFRQGDAQFVSVMNPNGQILRFGDGSDAMGLTMGQILSLPLVLVGIVFWVVSRRRKAA